MEETKNRSFLKRLFHFTPLDIIRLVLISVGVGVVLAFLNVDPAALWGDFFGTFAHAWQKVIYAITHIVDWSLNYFVLGAILVVPIFIVLRLLKAVRG